MSNNNIFEIEKKIFQDITANKKKYFSSIEYGMESAEEEFLEILTSSLEKVGLFIKRDLYCEPKLYFVGSAEKNLRKREKKELEEERMEKKMKIYSLRTLISSQEKEINNLKKNERDISQLIEKLEKHCSNFQCKEKDWKEEEKNCEEMEEEEVEEKKNKCCSPSLIRYLIFIEKLKKEKENALFFIHQFSEENKINNLELNQLLSSLPLLKKKIEECTLLLN